MISLIEKKLGRKATIDLQPLQPGDVKESYAEIDHSEKKLNYRPKTSIIDGIPKFIDWYNKYYG